jgi:SAM-dependent methyltransferase
MQPLSLLPVSSGLASSYRLFKTLVVDPRVLVNRWRGVPFFFRNLALYQRAGPDEFPITMRDLYYMSHERFSAAGTAKGHYFHQDLWAARKLYEGGVRHHVDVGSRIDGFVAHVLPFCEVDYVDIRPLDTDIQGLAFRRGSAVEMPFESSSVASLSSLHVLEHIGLGRYGDPVDPSGYRRAASEFKRVLAPDGTLLLGTPVGRERLCFDAHRVFDPERIAKLFSPLRLESFAIVPDGGDRVIQTDFEHARRHDYACGLFTFRKDSFVA